MSTKDPSKLPFVTKKPRKKKPKDKPKRPLSAYNYFFREEREKITRFLLNKDDTYGIETGLDPEHTRELMTEKGKVKFEEVGKLIGKRWKTLTENASGEEEVKRYAGLAATDAERYKKELREYNETKSKQEAAAAAAFPQGGAMGMDKRGRNMPKGGYQPSGYPGQKDSMAPGGRHDAPYGSYPPSMYGGGPSMYYPPYPVPGGGGQAPYPPSSMAPGGQPMGGYSHPYDNSYGQPMDGRMGYGSPPQSQYQNPPNMSTGGGYGGDPNTDHSGGFRPGSRGHVNSQPGQSAPPPSGYHDTSQSTIPSYDDQNYDAHGGQNYGSQSQPYPGSSHYPPHGGQQYQGGPYPPSSYNQSWGPQGYGGDGQKSQQHWGAPST